MPVTTLYLVRHGETDYNKGRIIQGRQINSALNATGRMQAEALGRRLADVPVDAIYTSTLTRAEETGAYIASHHPGVPVHRLADLEEMSWGVLEGEALTPDVEEALEEIRRRWEVGDFSGRVEEGESILDVQERGIRAVEHIVARHPGETVVVVTHGRLLRVTLSTLLEEYGLERMHDIDHANTCVNHLVFEGDRCTARLLNCTAHLDEVETILVE